MPLPQAKRALGGIRALVGLSFAGLGSAVFALVSTGTWDPVPISPPPVSMPETPSSEDYRLAQIGEARVFSLAQLALPPEGAPVSTTVVWKARGEKLLPARAGSSISGFSVSEPRVTIVGELDEPTTEIRAPEGTFTLLREKDQAALVPAGEPPVVARGRLVGGVRVEQPGLAIETDHMTLHMLRPPGPPPASGGGGTIQRLRKLDQESVRLETDSPVRGTLVRTEKDGTTHYTAFRAEGGLKARGDLKRLKLLGPVMARDSEGDLLVDARDEVELELCSPQDFKGWMRVEAGSFVLRSLSGRGNVALHLRRPAFEDQPEADLTVQGERVDVDLSAGTLDIQGSPGYLAERTSGRSIRANHIWSRDLEPGREGLTEFHADGDATFDAAIRHMRREQFPRRWEVSGDSISGLLRKTVTKKERTKHPENPMPRLTVASSHVTSSPARKGTFASHGGPRGDMHGSFSVLDSREDEDGNLEAHARSEGEAEVEMLTDESRIVARHVKVERPVGTNDRVELDGDTVALVGSDLVALAREAEADPNASDEGNPLEGAAGPYHARGDRLQLELSPKAVHHGREVPWYERSSLVSAHLDGAPGHVDGKDEQGRPFFLEGTSLDLDTALARVSAVSTADLPAIATIGSTEVSARKLAGNLRSGEVSGEGDLRSKGTIGSPDEGPAGARAFSFRAPRGTARLEPDPRRQRDLRAARRSARIAGNLPVDLPAEVLAFHAEGDPQERVHVEADGSSLEADALEWDARTRLGWATSREDGPRVKLKTKPRPDGSGGDEVLARTVAVASSSSLAGAVPYRIDLVDQVHVEGRGTPSWLGGGGPDRPRPDRKAGRFQLDSDRARADISAGSVLGKRELAWGPVVAWSDREPRVVVSRSDGTPEGEVHATARVLRTLPDTGEVVLTGREDDPVRVVGGADRISSVAKNSALLEPEAGRAARRDLARGSENATRSRKTPPFALVAERLEARAFLSEVERERSEDGKRAETRTEEKGSTAELLREIRSLHGERGLFAWVGDETVTGDTVDYDGLARRATILPRPGEHVHVSDAMNHEQTSLRWTWKIDDPLPR